ncbi:hypothetical protein H696_00456 [Fonticula alba]|uniref:Uncharacterized protein n=1 Tax=Fonticula alba TaxID=691883 RepID=A0A058ZEP9_FONAL|nr:hypothetical protein H696_00456 [Fonticula alba]KCV72885.1 hypothetical protein H696_00456 [Fonticula alba]|eukprot:XP_009492586.1 hypothetical protein H696_00456 [Fonticula alba]
MLNVHIALSPTSPASPASLGDILLDFSLVTNLPEFYLKSISCTRSVASVKSLENALHLDFAIGGRGMLPALGLDASQTASSSGAGSPTMASSGAGRGSEHTVSYGDPLPADAGPASPGSPGGGLTARLVRMARSDVPAAAVRCLQASTPAIVAEVSRWFGQLVAHPQLNRSPYVVAFFVAGPVAAPERLPTGPDPSLDPSLGQKVRGLLREKSSLLSLGFGSGPSPAEQVGALPVSALIDVNALEGTSAGARAAYDTWRHVSACAARLTQAEHEQAAVREKLFHSLKAVADAETSAVLKALAHGLADFIAPPGGDQEDSGSISMISPADISSSDLTVPSQPAGGEPATAGTRYIFAALNGHRYRNAALAINFFSSHFVKAYDEAVATHAKRRGVSNSPAYGSGGQQELFASVALDMAAENQQAAADTLKKAHAELLWDLGLGEMQPPLKEATKEASLPATPDVADAGVLATLHEEDPSQAGAQEPPSEQAKDQPHPSDMSADDTLPRFALDTRASLDALRAYARAELASAEAALQRCTELRRVVDPFSFSFE